ncbi:DUF2953 domain-containing protein [Paenibacillus yanchengensis]|uniref:DUF2953 domain-containing protein n=1 Tax=Paenibacillus yanchengensis TaxID=2035833 RepID=A0ABW4YK24_9BACL
MRGFTTVGWIWVIVSLFFLLFIIAVLISSVKIECSYIWQSKRNRTMIRVVACYGLIKYKKVIDRSQNGENSADTDAMNMVDGLRNLFKLMKSMTEQLQKLFKHMKFTQFRWHTTVGTGDAMWTAMTCGSVSTIQSFIIAYLLQHINFVDKPSTVVKPIYSHPIFATRWSCIAQISLGKAIIAGLALLAHMNKEKGAIRAWQNILSKA